MSARPGSAANRLQVTVGGTSLGSYTPSGSPWTQVQTAAFTASQAAMTLAFAGQTAGGSGTGIDVIQVVPQ